MTEEIKNYDVVIQFRKGLLEKDETMNIFFLFIDHTYYKSGGEEKLEELRELLPERVIFGKDPKSIRAYGAVFTVKCSKFVSAKYVGETLNSFFKENNIRYIKE